MPDIGFSHSAYGACAAAARAAFASSSEIRRRDVGIYVAHTVAGLSMRAIARAEDKTPSTILRAVRRIEAARDDPLLDRLIARLEPRVGAADPSQITTTEPNMKPGARRRSDKPTKSERIALERLAETGAFLLVAAGAAKAGVFCAKNGFRRPLSLIPEEAAMRFLRDDWVKCVSSTDQSAKYVMNDTGRAAVRRMTAATAPRADTGFAESMSAFTGQHQLAGARRIANHQTGEIETIGVNLGESPLGWLSKRRDAKGRPLLDAIEVEAGERLREDFEMAQCGPRIGQDWRRFLTPSRTAQGDGAPLSDGAMFAKDRVTAALTALGPGLSDAAVRICCFLEGLEATERRMGWSARSGKVVLKLALQRLVDHYGLIGGARDIADAPAANAAA